MASAFMAFLHHLFAFTVAACIVYEFLVYRKELSITEARRLQRVDIAYGISAGLLLVVGLLRVFFFEKGVNFYTHSPMFWIKMGLFLTVGLLSISPTIHFIRWNSTLGRGQSPEISDVDFKRVRLLIHLELMCITLILLAAPAMARGIGM